MNPTIIQRRQLQQKLWKLVQPDHVHNYFGENDMKRAYLQELGYSLPIDRYTTPVLFHHFNSVKERLRMHEDVFFCVDNRVHIGASSISSEHKQFPSIVSLSSGAVNTLNDGELDFIVGHELGHIIMHSGLVKYYYKTYDKDPTPELDYLYHVFALLTELEADRYGYLACGSLEAYISCQYKVYGGLDQHKFGVPTTLFLEANRRIVEMFLPECWIGNEHPVNALRIEAIHIFATSKSSQELEIRMQPIIRSIYKQ